MANTTQSPLDTLLQQYTQSASEARAENEKRYAQAMGIYDEIIRRYSPGGYFQQAALGQLETRKEREVGGGMQQMISSGLYGTTGAAGVGRRWEAEVGGPARLSLEDLMMSRLSEAQAGKAGFIERREDVYPDYATMAQLAMQAGQAKGGTYVLPPSGGQLVSQMPDPFATLNKILGGFGGGGGQEFQPATGDYGQSYYDMLSKKSAEAEQVRQSMIGAPVYGPEGGGMSEAERAAANKLVEQGYATPLTGAAGQQKVSDFDAWQRATYGNVIGPYNVFEHTARQKAYKLAK